MVWDYEHDAVVNCAETPHGLCVNYKYIETCIHVYSAKRIGKHVLHEALTVKI